MLLGIPRQTLKYKIDKLKIDSNPDKDSNDKPLHWEFQDADRKTVAIKQHPTKNCRMLFIYSIIPFLQIPTIVDNSKEYNKDKLSTFGITIAINKLPG